MAGIFSPRTSSSRSKQVLIRAWQFRSTSAVRRMVGARGRDELDGGDAGNQVPCYQVTAVTQVGLQL